jgi:hypothetical protein
MKNFALIVYNNDSADVQLCSTMHEVDKAIMTVRDAGYIPLCIIDTIKLFHTWLVADQSFYSASVLRVMEEKIFVES